MPRRRKMADGPPMPMESLTLSYARSRPLLVPSPLVSDTMPAYDEDAPGLETYPKLGTTTVRGGDRFVS